MDKEIRMYYLFGDQYIIGELDMNMAQNTTYIHLENPRVFVCMPTMQGTMRVGFQPVCMFSKKVLEEIDIPRDHVFVSIPNSEIPKEVENGYISSISGISIASASDVAAVNSVNEKAKGEFVL